MEIEAVEEVNSPQSQTSYKSPETKYFKTREELDIAVGEDFIRHANETTAKGEKFLVGLSHGQSPSGAYQYIFEQYHKILKPELIRYSFVNSPLKRQRDLKGVLDAHAFLKELAKAGHLENENILGSNLQRDKMEVYAKEFNARFKKYLKENKKEGSDYVFLATNSAGHVAGISYKSEAFQSKDIATIVHDRKEKELTVTPFFLLKTRRIAFLATKSDKRRALVKLLYRNAKPDTSPGFLSYMEDVENRMTVFVNDEALTWPQVEVERQTRFGPSTIRIDVSKPFNENNKRKLPIVLMIHGFLGLNSYDGLLTLLPSSKYIGAAMHYGSIPDELPIERYSKHIINNIDAAVAYFGKLGHPVYLFDHSMGNIYFMMIRKEIDRLKGIQQYLCGRIGANPFFGIEAKHALLGFLDNVILPSFPKGKNSVAKTLFAGIRKLIPLDTKKGVRKRGISITNFFVGKDAAKYNWVWKAVKDRILFLMTNMDSLPPLNRIPMEKAMNRLPAKLFIIQIHSALVESENLDSLEGINNLDQYDIPIKILKSDRDSVAEYVPEYYDHKVTVLDATNEQETDLFREHLFHMVHPEQTVEIIDEFISKHKKK